MSGNKRRVVVMVIALAVLAAGAVGTTGLPYATGQQPGPGADPLPAGALKRLGTTRFRHGSRILCMAYSPDGKTLVAGGGDDPVRVWDAETGKEKFQLKEPWVYAAAFSPDGQTIATGGGFKTVRRWNASNGTEILPPLKGHTGTIKALVFSPDGTQLASAGQDKTVRMWGVPSRTTWRASFLGHEDEVKSTLAVLNPDGSTNPGVGGRGPEPALLAAAQRAQAIRIASTWWLRRGGACLFS